MGLAASAAAALAASASSAAWALAAFSAAFLASRRALRAARSLLLGLGAVLGRNSPAPRRGAAAADAAEDTGARGQGPLSVRGRGGAWASCCRRIGSGRLGGALAASRLGRTSRRLLARRRALRSSRSSCCSASVRSAAGVYVAGSAPAAAASGAAAIGAATGAADPASGASFALFAARAAAFLARRRAFLPAAVAAPPPCARPPACAPRRRTLSGGTALSCGLGGCGGGRRCRCRHGRLCVRLLLRRAALRARPDAVLFEEASSSKEDLHRTSRRRTSRRRTSRRRTSRRRTSRRRKIFFGGRIIGRRLFFGGRLVTNSLLRCECRRRSRARWPSPPPSFARRLVASDALLLFEGAVGVVSASAESPLLDEEASSDDASSDEESSDDESSSTESSSSDESSS